MRRSHNVGIYGPLHPTYPKCIGANEGKPPPVRLESARTFKKYRFSTSGRFNSQNKTPPSSRSSYSTLQLFQATRPLYPSFVLDQPVILNYAALCPTTIS